MIQETPTYCRICEVTCGLVATVEDGRVTRLRPDPDRPVSRGYSCPKGLAIEPLADMAWLRGFPLTVEKIAAAACAAG